MPNLDWEGYFELLKQYHEENEHSNVPSDHTDVNLWLWTCKNRREYKSGKLTEDRKSKLLSLQFIFHTI